MINFKKIFFNKKNIIMIIIIISISIYLFLFSVTKNNNKIINLANLTFDNKIYLNLLKLNNYNYNQTKITDIKIKEEFIKEFSRNIEKKIEKFNKNISLKNINLSQEINFEFHNDQNNSIDLIANPKSHYFKNKKTFLFEIVDYRKDLSKLNINYIFIKEINKNNINNELNLQLILQQIQKDDYFKNLSLDDIEINFVPLEENKIIIKAKPTSLNFKNEKKLFFKKLLELPIKIDTIQTNTIFSDLKFLSKDIDLVKKNIIEQLIKEPNMSDITLEDIEIEMNLKEEKIIVKSKPNNLNFQNEKIFNWKIIDDRRDLSNININNIWLSPKIIINNYLFSIKQEILSKIKKDFSFSDLTLEDFDIEIKESENKIIIKAKPTSLNFKNEKIFNWKNIDNRINLSEIKNQTISITEQKFYKDFDLIKESISQIQNKNKFDNFNSKEIDIVILSSHEIIVKPTINSLYFKNKKKLGLKIEKLKTDFKNIQLDNIYINEQNLENIDVIKFEIFLQIKQSNSFFSDLTLEDFDIELKEKENKIIIKAKPISSKFKHQKILDLIKKKEKKDLKQLNIATNNLKINKQNLINDSAVKFEILQQIKNLDLIFWNLTSEDFDVEILFNLYEIIIKAKETSLNFKNEKKINFLQNSNKKDLANIKINELYYTSEDNSDINRNSMKLKFLDQIKKTEPLFFNLKSEDFDLIIPKENKIIIKAKDISSNFENQKTFNFKKISLKTDLNDIKVEYIFIDKQNLSIESDHIQKFINTIKKESKFINLNINEIDIEIKEAENKIIIKAKPTSLNFKNKKELTITDNNFYSIKKDLQDENSYINNFNNVIEIKRKNYTDYQKNKQEVLKQLQKNSFFSDLTLEDFDIELKEKENKIIIKATDTSLNFKNEKVLSLLIIDERKNLNELQINYFNLSRKNKNNIEEIKKSLILQIKKSNSVFSDLTLEDFDIEIKEAENKIIIKAKDTSLNFKNKKVLNFQITDNRIDLTKIKKSDITIQEKNLNNIEEIKKSLILQIKKSNSVFSDLTLEDFDIKIKEAENQIIIKAKDTSLNFKNKKVLSLLIIDKRKNLNELQINYFNLSRKNKNNIEEIKKSLILQIKKSNSVFSDLTLEDFDIEIKEAENKIIIKAKDTSLNFKNKKVLNFQITDNRIDLTKIKKSDITIQEKNLNNIEEIKKSLILQIKKSNSVFSNLTLEDFDIEIKEAENQIIIKATDTSLNFKNKKVLNFQIKDDRIDLIKIKKSDITIQEEILNNDDLFKQTILQQIQSSEPQINSFWNSLTINDFKIIKTSEKKITIEALEESNNYKNKKKLKLKIKKSKIDLETLKNSNKIFLDYQNILTDDYHNQNFKNYIKDTTLLEIKKITNLKDLNTENLVFDFNIDQQTIKVTANKNNKYLKNSQSWIFIIKDPRTNLTDLNLPKLEINLSDNNEVTIKNKIIKMIQEKTNFQNVSSTDFEIKINSINKIINIKSSSKNIKFKEEIDLNYSIIDNRKDLVNLNIIDIKINEEALIINNNINIKNIIFSKIKEDINFNDLTLEDFDIEIKETENKIIIKAKDTSLNFKNEKILNLIIENRKIDLSNIKIKKVNISNKYLINSDIISKENNNIKKEILSQIKKELNFNDLTLDDFDINIIQEPYLNNFITEICHIQAKPTSLKFRNKTTLNINILY